MRPPHATNFDLRRLGGGTGLQRVGDANRQQRKRLPPAGGAQGSQRPSGGQADQAHRKEKEANQIQGRREASHPGSPARVEDVCARLACGLLDGVLVSFRRIGGRVRKQAGGDATRSGLAGKARTGQDL